MNAFAFPLPRIGICTSWKFSLQCLVATSLVSLSSQLCSGQSYLDQLENIVNQVRGQQPPEPQQSTTEELPRPQKTPNLAPTVPENQDKTGGGIFLGLEAEDVTGGGLGVAVTTITENSPAWKAGFRVGDRIVAVNGFAISGLDQMADQLFKLGPGDTCRFLVTRGSRNQQLTAVLMDANLATRIHGVPNSQSAATMQDAGKAWLGVLVNDLTPAFRAQFGQRITRGAAVTSVTQGSPAWDAGIRAGDCISEFAQRPIGSADDMIGLLGSLRAGQLAEVIYYRGVIRRTTQITLAAQPRDSVASSPRRNDSQPSSATPRTAPRVPTNPSVVDKNATGGTKMELPPFLLPQDPAASNTDPVLADKTPRDAQAAPSGVETQSVAQLEQTVAELRRELDEKNRQIEEMQNRLRGILQSLGGGR